MWPSRKSLLSRKSIKTSLSLKYQATVEKFYDRYFKNEEQYDQDSECTKQNGPINSNQRSTSHLKKLKTTRV